MPGEPETIARMDLKKELLRRGPGSLGRCHVAAQAEAYTAMGALVKAHSAHCPTVQAEAATGRFNSKSSS